MRIRLPVGRTLFFLGAFFLSLIALLPLRLAVDWFGIANRGIAAREVQGSVWFGGLKEAQVATIGLGDLATGVHILPLLVGRARFALNRRDGAPGDAFRAGVNVTPNTFGVDDVTGRLLITAGALGRLPLSQIDLTDVTARFDNGQCAEAAGNVQATLSGDIGGVSLPGGLSGAARCDAGALLLAMVSQSGMESVELRLMGDGRFTGTLLMRSTDQNARDRMTAAGLTASALGYEMTVSGQF
jgi:general secretion pathway protein N